MQIYWNITRYLLGIFEVWICLKYIELFFEKRYSEKMTKIISWMFIGIVSAVIYFNQKTVGYSLALICLLILVISIFASQMYKSQSGYSLTIVGMYYLTLTASELFFVYTLGMLLLRPKLGILVSESTDTERIITLFVIRCIMYLLYLLAKRVDACYITNGNNMKFLNIIMVIEAIGIYAFQYMYGYEIVAPIEFRQYLFFLTFILMFFVVFIYFYLRVQREKFRYATFKAELLEYNYHSIYEEYVKSQKIYHDMKNHLIIINQHVLENENDKALKYIQSIGGPIFYLDHHVWSGISVIDYVLNYKLMEAQKENIEVEYNIDEMADRGFMIQDDELCALLSNLLDNAIEASKKLEEDKRKMKVTIKYINNMLMIKTSNRALSPPVKKNGKYLSQKKDKGRHGIGISSIEKVVSKYDGCVDFTYDKEIFSASATLFC